VESGHCANVPNGWKADVAGLTNVAHCLPMRRNPDHYRGEAERCRKLAEDTSNREVKANLLDVARQYDDLAGETEQRG
jgi:hypothetical protein